jgi:hypothetical protein
VLARAGVLVEHPLGQEQQHQQAGGERRLHHRQRGQQQGHELQREAEDRQAGPEQPARAPDQSSGQREAQMLLLGGLLGLRGLEGDP